MKILLNVAHSEDTPGKRSPDGRFRETRWSEMVCSRIAKEFEKYGRPVKIIRQETFYGPGNGLKQVVSDINAECSKDDCILVSIHVNAAGSGKEWMKATGWSAYTTKGKTKSDSLAEDLYWAASQWLPGKKLRKDTSDGDSDIEENFYVLKGALCPAVLTENFFQDNKEDVEFLESEEGIERIVGLHVDGILAYLQKL